jgi:hypothetical protein
MIPNREQLELELFPMDVILSVSYARDHYFKWPPWSHWPIALAIGGIKRHQGRRFGNTPYADLTHGVFFIDPDHIANCTTPRTKWSTVEQILGTKDPIMVMRHESIGPDKYVPDPHVLRWIMDSSQFPRPTGIDPSIPNPDRLIGQGYDYLELTTHLIGEVLGYDTSLIKATADVLGMGKNRMVCTVLIMTMFQRYRKIVTPMPYSRIYKTHIELSSPALLAVGEPDNQPLKVIYDEVNTAA